MVCSHASAIGHTIIQTKNPIPTKYIDATVGNIIQIDQLRTLIARRVKTGFFPSPYLATIVPPMMNPILVTASTTHHISTDTSESPYASMSDINTPPIKLLIIAKNIIAINPGIERMIRIVPRISTFLSSSCRSSRCGSAGKWSMRRCVMTASITTNAIPTAHIIPSCPMITHEKADTTVNTSHCIIPTFPLALSRSHSGTRSVTSVESAMTRILLAVTPSMIVRIKIQSHTLVTSPHVSLGRSASMESPSV